MLVFILEAHGMLMLERSHTRRIYVPPARNCECKYKSGLTAVKIKYTHMNI